MEAKMSEKKIIAAILIGLVCLGFLGVITNWNTIVSVVVQGGFPSEDQGYKFVTTLSPGEKAYTYGHTITNVKGQNIIARDRLTGGESFNLNMYDQPVGYEEIDGCIVRFLFRKVAIYQLEGYTCTKNPQPAP
jgi:hypothetical protein